MKFILFLKYNSERFEGGELHFQNNIKLKLYVVIENNVFCKTQSVGFSNFDNCVFQKINFFNAVSKTMIFSKKHTVILKTTNTLNEKNCLFFIFTNI